MGEAHQRRSERILLTIPIVVMGVDPDAGQFSEETHTIVVNREGARVTLKHRVIPEDTIHIINLENFVEADFRVVGPISVAEGAVPEWGVECLKEGVNIWGIEFSHSLPAERDQVCALLECRACLKKFFWPVTFMEVVVLDSTGVIQSFCDHCGKQTYWTYANGSNRRKEFSPSDPVAPPPRTPQRPERRTNTRLLIKLPILVRNHKGEEAIARTENVSRLDLAVSLGMKLSEGEPVTVICPYEVGSRNIERKAEVRRRAFFSFGKNKLYGLRYQL